MAEEWVREVGKQGQVVSQTLQGRARSTGCYGRLEVSTKLQHGGRLIFVTADQPAQLALRELCLLKRQRASCLVQLRSFTVCNALVVQSADGGIAAEEVNARQGKSRLMRGLVVTCRQRAAARGGSPAKATKGPPWITSI